MRRCIIFTGGNPEPRLPEGLDTKNAFIIAADSGYKNCKELGITPDLAVGDYDSLGFEPNDCERISMPCEKDDTDLMFAAREAIKRGRTDITILGAMGGRFDHTFANVQTLAFIQSRGGRGRILSQNELIALVTPGKYTVGAKRGFSLSLFSYGGEVTGLTIKGVKYALENGSVSDTFPIGISNEILGESAEISFERGRLLIVQSRL